MIETLLICFREGVEAFLIIAIASLAIKKMGLNWLMSAIYVWIALALATSIGLGITLAYFGALSSITAGWLAIAAAIAILWCVIHMHHAGPNIAQVINQKLSDISHKMPFRAWCLVAAFTFFMIAREGIEAATMIASFSIDGGAGGMVAGGLIGLSLAALGALTWVKYGRAVPIKSFFKMSEIILFLLGFQILIYGIHEFTEAMAIPLIDNALWHQRTESLAEGWASQALFAGLLILPLTWIVMTYAKSLKQSGPISDKSR